MERLAAPAAVRASLVETMVELTGFGLATALLWADGTRLGTA